MRQIILDTETTGLDPAQHGLLEIGAVHAQTGEEFQTAVRCWPGASIQREALAVNGITYSQVDAPERPHESDALRALLQWLPPQCLIAGMNPSFDRSFLDAAVRRHRGLPSAPWSHRTLDLHSLALAYAVRRGVSLPERGFHTDAIYEMLGLPPEPKPHAAITGARREFDAFQRIFTELRA